MAARTTRRDAAGTTDCFVRSIEGSLGCEGGDPDCGTKGGVGSSLKSQWA
jgi:hypothetical protein